MLTERHKDKGFTLIELVVSIAVMSVIAVVTTGMLFAGMTWADKVRSIEDVSENVKVLGRAIRIAVEGASDISGGNGTLLVVGDEGCWSFVWDQLSGVVNYEHVAGGGCVPNPNPTGLILGDGIIVQALNFDIVDLELGGRQVVVAGSLSKKYPLGDSEKEIGLTVINYMIGEK